MKQLLHGALLFSILSIACLIACKGSAGTVTNISADAGNRVAPSPEATIASQPSPQLSTEEQLRDQALKLGKEFLEKHIIQCGDSFYWRIYRPGRGETLTYEGKDRLETDIKGKYYSPKELSQAQRLNGEDEQPLEWSGYVTIHFGAGRMLAGTWRDNSYVSAEVNRCKGKWYVNAATFAGIKTRSPYGAAEPYGIQSAFEPNSPTHDKFVEIECDK